MPDLIDEIRSLALKIERSKSLVTTEEATKNAFVMPFIAALGYDVFDPTEVVPELVADVGIKKGEKIDYAIRLDGKITMLFECKHHAANLDNDHASQLFRYFACHDCRVAVLTNGVEYRFFSDLDAPNKMDAKPFLVFKVGDFSEAHVRELKKFTKQAFNIDTLLSTANELKYMREIKSLLAAQAVSPSDEFVRFCAAGIGIPRMTQAVRDQFGELTRKAFSEFLSESMGEKIKSALASSYVAEPDVEPSESAEQGAKVETTAEELEAFYVIKSILRDSIDVRRITHRDQQTYFSILLDNNNRKPIARIHFNAKSQKYIGLFDEAKSETRIAIGDVDEIYKHSDQIKATALSYDDR